MPAIEKCSIKAVCLLLIWEHLETAGLGAGEASEGPSANSGFHYKPAAYHPHLHFA